MLDFYREMVKSYPYALPPGKLALRKSVDQSISDPKDAILSESDIASDASVSSEGDHEISLELKKYEKNFKLRQFPSHADFLQMLMDGTKKANSTNSTVSIKWRGYCATLKPSRKELDEMEMKDLLLDALRSIRMLTQAEKKVIFF